MVREDTRRTGAHGISEGALRAQATAMGLPIQFGYSSFESYEEKWGLELDRLKREGVDTGVFGDIDLEEHYVWIERVMNGHGLRMFMPLWLERRDSLVREFVDKGYRAIIISIKKGAIGESYLGRELDMAAIADMERDGLDPSGEGGEFHTFVFDGPCFSKKVEYGLSGRFEDADNVYLDLQVE
jgi:uncharacterized protein (TIGR00290 family)